MEEQKFQGQQPQQPQQYAQPQQPQQYAQPQEPQQYAQPQAYPQYPAQAPQVGAQYAHDPNQITPHQQQ